MALRVKLFLTPSWYKVPVRFKSQRRTLGKAPEISRNLEQRFELLNYKDPALYYKVNIGFKEETTVRRKTTEERIKVYKENKANKDLEKAAREDKLLIPLEGVEECWAASSAPQHIKAAAEHYGIFEHLFGDSYFLPVIKIDINYPFEGGYHPVCRGNHLTPEVAKSEPHVEYKSSPESLWTLLMTSPDGHLDGTEQEYVHWLVGNIKGNNISTGQVIKPYMQPFPSRGLGYLRYVFVLFKQDDVIDLSNILKEKNSINLPDRTFSTYDFYRARQDSITPAGLAWFQATWDSSVTDFYQKVLGFDEEPKFSYDFEKQYHPAQTWFPIRKPFNLYLDRYRDEKQIAKEFIIKRLKNIDPFKPSPYKLKFPNAVPFKRDTPSWLKNEIRKERLGLGRIQEYE